MYSLVKKIHLVSCFIISAFLLIFFISGLVVIMEKTFPRKPIYSFSETIHIKKVPENEKEFMKNIYQRFNIHGEVTEKVNNDERRVLKIYRPGYRAGVVLNKKKKLIEIDVTQKNFADAINDFHRLLGFEGSWAHKIWAIMYDLSCISLLVFAFTGIYMWWKSEKKKLPGMAFLFISTGLTVFTIWYLISVC